MQNQTTKRVTNYKNLTRFVVILSFYHTGVAKKA